MKIINLRKTNSTNQKIKEFIKGGVDVALFSKIQSGGKGTKGRNFDSKKGGLYLSVLNFYQNYPATKNFEIMIKSSLAVIKTFEDFGVNCGIKWPNDIIYKGKKICGILIENALIGDRIAHSITGIGINLQNKLPIDLIDTATTAKKILGKKLNFKKFKDILLTNFINQKCDIEKYRNKLIILGKTVLVTSFDISYYAKVLDVSNDGMLKVKREDEILYLSSAEISISLGG